jgi:hypothetical protein
MSIKEERSMILTMIAEGKITAEEGDRLLQALEQSEQNKHESMKRKKLGGIPGVPPIPSLPSLPRVPSVPRIFSGTERDQYGNLVASVRDGYHDPLGITEEYVKEFEEVGYSDLDYDEFHQFRIHGITPLYIEGLTELGLEGLGVS